VLLDGGTGTELQRFGMPPGVSTEGWAAEHADTLAAIHRSYIEAGSDGILTCTFGGTAPKLGGRTETARINTLMADIALRAADGRAAVAASIGPTGQLLHPSGSLRWREAYGLYCDQATALLSAGIDAFFLETFSDPRELKAALLAIRDAAPDAFISAQMTFGSGALTLTGTSPTAMALLLDQLPVDAAGVNCSSGPADLLPVFQEIARFTGKPLAVEPNAGLPDADGTYHMSPETFAGWIEDFAWAGAAIVGGCCGTGPAHIAACRDILGRRRREPAAVEDFRALTSIDRIVPLGTRTLSVGESINPTGRESLQASIARGDFLGVTSLARAQGRADLIDVNLGLERTLPEGFVPEVFSRLSIGAPISVDLSSPLLLEEAFSESGGLWLLNSLTADREHIEARVRILLRHGGYAVLLPISRRSTGLDPADRLVSLRDGIGILEEAGIDRRRIVADPLVKPVGTGADPGSTFRTLTLFKAEGLLTIAGISNVSHGMPGRSGLNSAMLAVLESGGLDLAIFDVLDSQSLEIHRGTQVLLGKLEPVEQRLPELSLIGESPDYLGILVKSIVIGDRRQTETAGRELLDAGIQASVILEKGLGEAMRTVGDLYGRRKLFLPHLIASAEAASTLTALLEPHLEKEGGRTACGRVVIASVRGDVHDIGKNLVTLFLRNSGFEVTDLSTDVPTDRIVEAAVAVNTDIVALSALMSSTAPEMERIIRLLRERGVRSRVLVGGAVVTRAFAESIGADGYAQDAYGAVTEALRLMQESRTTHEL
jgi:5-methyltetrahydrofolate--homocysteine methyltransferase